jgi:hypothetical protein
MPNPTQADLHVNVPLTNVSVAYIQSAKNFISDKIFPKVPVSKQSDLYWKYSKSDWRRTDVQRRAPSTETPGTGWNVNTDQYFAHVYGVHKDIDDQLRANSDSVFKMDSDATAFVTNQLLLKRDLDWTASYFRTGVWGQDIQLKKLGSTPAENQRWDLATSDPVSWFATAQVNFIQQTGFKANTLVLGAYVIKALKNHPAIIDRIKYTQKGIVTTDLIAELFDVEKIVVSYATINNGPDIPDMKAQDAAGSMAFISNPTSALFCYTTSSPSLMQPTAGYTFTWNGYLGGNAQGIRMARFRQEAIRSDRIEGEMTYDMKVVCPDMGLFLSDVVGAAPDVP